MSGLLAHAQRLVTHFQFSVIPLWRPDRQHNGKEPALPEWTPFQTQRPSVDQLRAWFRTWDARNIGIVCGAISGVVVIDADSAEATAWVQAHLPATPWRCLSHRGTHFYYQHPGGLVRSRVVRHGAIKLEVLADGHYCVGPTSRHESGDVYLASGDWGADRSTVPVYSADWLRDLLPEPRPPAPVPPRPAGDAVARAAAYARKVPCPPIGSGSDAATFQLACRLVRGFGLTDDEALAVLLAWSADQPWDRAWLERKIASARAHGREDVGGML